VQIPVQHTQDTNEQTKKGEDHTQNTTDDGDWWDRVWKSTDDNILDTIKDMYNYIQLSMGAFEVFSGMGVHEFGMDAVRFINSGDRMLWLAGSAATMISSLGLRAAGVGWRAAQFVIPDPSQATQAIVNAAGPIAANLVRQAARQGQPRMYRGVK
jgi:hypothetical protein